MKTKVPIILCIIINLLSILIIPINLFLLNMPLWISLVFIALTIIILINLYKASKNNRPRNIILTITSIVSTFFIIIGSFCNPFWNSINFKSYENTKPLDATLTNKEAIKDLNYAMKYLKKVHPLYKNGVSKEVTDTYNQCVKTINSLPNITVAQLYGQIQLLVSCTPDKHTAVYASEKDKYILEDYVNRTLNKETLAKINDVPVDTFFKEHEKQVNYEAGTSGTLELLDMLYFLDTTQLLGLNPKDGIKFTYITGPNITTSITYTSEDYVSYNEYKDRKKNEPITFVLYNIDKGNDLATLTLNSCTYNDTYKGCVKEMFTKVKEQGINNVVVDLRKNGGGSSFVAEEFIRYLDVDKYNTDQEYMRLGLIDVPILSNKRTNKKYTDLLFHGKVYILTSNNTFSSAMLFAQYIKDNKLGTIIGETPLNDPNGYGEVVSFRLPNSKLCFGVSSAYFVRADSSCKEKFVEPHYPCKSTDAERKLFEIIK